MCLSYILISSVCKILIIISSICKINGVKISSNKEDMLVYYVKENSPVGAIIGQISIHGFILPFDIHEFQERNIVIVKESGIIRVADALDREKRSSYSFLIISASGDTKNLKVIIQDENDNAPRFNITSLEKIIPENYPVGSKVDLTSVFDPDEGVNSIDRITITSGDPDGQFGIDFYNGGNGNFYLRLILMKQLDFETATSYNMVVQASDGGRPRLHSSFSLKVHIENANDNAPKFDLSRYVVSVRENQTVGLTLMKVHATDKDEGQAGELVYLLDDSLDSKLFSINEKTGEISLKGLLDYEKRRQLTMNVAVRDNVLPYHTSRASLIVDVVDINDNPPSLQISWPQQRQELDINSEPDSVVAHLTAIDPDSVSSHFFLRILNDSPLKISKIQTGMWELKTTNLLKTIKTDNISLSFELTDYPPPSFITSKTVSIKIKRLRADSVALSKKKYSIKLLRPISRPGETITIISLGDARPPELAEIYFSLSDDEKSLFKIDRHGGQITSAALVDCGDYRFTVSLHSTRTSLAIDRAEVAVSIEGNHKSNLYFAEGFRRTLLQKPMGSADCISQVIVANMHCGMSTTYKVETLMKGTRSFHMTNSGDLCINRAIGESAMVPKRYLVKVVASEKDSVDASTNVLLIPSPPSGQLQVLTNEVVVTLGSQNHSIPVARVVATIEKYPPHLYYGLVQYALRPQTTEAETLTKVDQITGEVFVYGRPRHDDLATVIEVSQRSNNRTIASTAVTITLRYGGSVRFSKPLYEFYIVPDYNASPERVVGQVVLEDASVADGTISYHLKGSGPTNNVFSINSDSGVISARNIPPQLYISSLKVSAEWKGSTRCYAQVLVMVDTIISPPSFGFTTIDVNVWENATVGTEVIQMIPSSSSWSDVYSISYGRFSHLFTIHPRSGQIFLRAKLDREETKRAVITIELKNRWGSVKGDLNINVLDNNDNEPACKESIVNITIGDDVQIGYVTCPLQCTDADTSDNGNLTYSFNMIFPNGVNSPLNIHPLTGCLEVVSVLDLWRLNHDGTYRYSVAVSDNGRDGALETKIKVNVKVVDSNNHKPYIASYSVFHVYEEAAFGTVVGTLVLEDNDLNDSVTITIYDQQFDHYLYIETLKRNEAILRSRDVRGLKIGTHNVLMKLEDDGVPMLTSYANITIKVEDSNDHDPEILFPWENQTIPFQCPLFPGTTILALRSRDSDLGLNSKLNFFIDDDEEKDVFTISRWSGVLTAKHQPHCSQSRRLKIHAHDMGHPRRSTSVNIVLIPMHGERAFNAMVTQNISFVVPEKAQDGHVLGVLRLNQWMESLGMTYLFGGSSTISPDQTLHIDYGDQRLTLLKNNDHIGTKTYPITVFYNKVPVPPRSVDLYLHLHWNRLANLWPSFLNQEAVVKVKENEPPGTVVQRFSTKYSENNAVIFSLRQPGYYFVIDPTTGIMVTFVSMDREKMAYDEFFVEIIATDFGDPEKTAVMPIHVVIEDENDNPPVIISPVYTRMDVVLTDSKNDSVARVVALDLDKGKNGQLRYSIGDPDLFTIDLLSGVIWLNRIPRVKTYDLNVSVSDCGWPSKTSWVLLTFNFQTSGMEERIRLTTNIISMNLSLSQSQRLSILGRVTVAASPSYSNLNVRFHLMAGKFSHLFGIDPVRGDIKTLRHILISDVGNVEILKLSVVAYISKDPSNYDSSKLLIHIDHGNNNAPSFAKSNFVVRLPEGEAITDFLTVAANDPDFGIFGTVTYHLLGDTVDRRISIDPNSGRLSCTSLSYLDKKDYKLEVIATDSLGGPLSKNQSASLHVIVQNSKHQPMQFNSSHFTINVMENLQGGTSLGSITIKTSPLQSVIVYLLNPGHPLININSSTGQLKTNGPIDREWIQFIDVTVQAISTGTDPQNFQSAKATVNIKIMDENDNAPIPPHNPFIVHITDPNDLPSPLTKLSATDVDLSSNITFLFDLSDPSTRSLSKTYKLDPLSGILISRSKSLKTGPVQHVLRTLVSDNGSPARITHVLVHIFISHRTTLLSIGPEKAVFRIQENPSAGSFIGQISILSNCSSGRASFTILDGVNNELVFMHSSTGKIFVSSAGAIDRERVKQVILWTQGQCFGIDLFGYKKVVIEIEDLDDNRPLFSQANYNAFVLEGQPPKTLVVRTSMYDPDEGINSQVEYFIELSSPLDEFSIDADGAIKTNIPLNFHTKSIYNLIIKATSKSTPLLFAECRVTVYIININDQRPIISSPFHRIQLQEDKPVGSHLITITATDSDGPGGISYRIRPRARLNTFLSIAYDSGEIFLSRKIVSSDIGSHEMDVVADDGKYSSSTILKVEVIDINNEFPDLIDDGSDFVISESVSFGSDILYLRAFDGDKNENGEVSFEISPPLPWLGLRDLQNNTAAVFLVSQPRYTSKVQFVGIQLTDKAKDQKRRLSSLSFISLLTESSNPHPPHFSNGTEATVKVSRSQYLGSKVTSVQCLDPDDMVTYGINSSDPLSPIHIDPLSGDIFFTEPFDNYQRSNFEVTVICRDNGKPRRQASFLLRIITDKKYKSLPIVTTDLIKLEVTQISRFPLFIGNLQTMEKQLWSNNHFTLTSAVPNYAVVGASNMSVFHADTSGNIWIVKVIQSGSWDLIFRVLNKEATSSNINSLFHCSYMKVKVEILNPPDEGSTNCIEIEKLTAVIKENELPPTSVINLPMWHKDITFSLLDDGVFSISCNYQGSSSCRVDAKTMLDFERNERYNLNVIVSGGRSGRKGCSHSMVLQVNVLDVDEYSPIFTHSEYRHSVSGGVPEQGSVLFAVSATDNDRGVFGLVFYRLEDSKNGLFGIRNSTGEIYLMVAFEGANESGSRKTRAVVDNKQERKNHRKTFLLQVVASSGEKSASANVLLNMLVPNIMDVNGQKTDAISLTPLQIGLIIGLPSVVIILTIIIAVFLIVWKRKCFYAKQKPSEPLYNDSEGSRSNPTDSLNNYKVRQAHYGHQPLPPRKSISYNNNFAHNTALYDQRALPDVAIFPPHPMNMHSLQNSETQEFIFNSDDNFQHPDNRNLSTLSHSSGTSSMKVEESMPISYGSESLRNGPPSSQFCDSGLGHNNRTCVCYNDNNNQRLHYRTNGHDIKSHESDRSGTSSSCYSVISQKHLQNQYPLVGQFNQADRSQRSIDHTMVAPKRMMPSKEMFTRSSVALKNEPETMPLRNYAQGKQRSYIDVRNNNHPSAMPLLARFDDRSYVHKIQFLNFPGCGSDRQMCQVVSVDVPSFSAISNLPESPSHHDTYAQTYSDITDIDC